jgi:hypothetical protein
MSDQSPQERNVDSLWPVVEAAARGLLVSKGCAAEQAEAILADMRPRCAGMPSFASTMKPTATAHSPRPKDLKKFVKEQGERFVTDVREHIDTLVGFFIQRIVDLEIELHAEKSKERRNV